MEKSREGPDNHSQMTSEAASSILHPLSALHDTCVSLSLDRHNIMVSLEIGIFIIEPNIFFGSRPLFSHHNLESQTRA